MKKDEISFTTISFDAVSYSTDSRLKQFLPDRVFDSDYGIFSYDSKFDSRNKKIIPFLNPAYAGWDESLAKTDYVIKIYLSYQPRIQTWIRLVGTDKVSDDKIQFFGNILSMGLLGSELFYGNFSSPDLKSFVKTVSYDKDLLGGEKGEKYTTQRFDYERIIKTFFGDETLKDFIKRQKKIEKFVENTINGNKKAKQTIYQSKDGNKYFEGSEFLEFAEHCSHVLSGPFEHKNNKKGCCVVIRNDQFYETKPSYMKKDTEYNWAVVIYGNDDTSYSKWFVSKEAAELEVEFLRFMQPIDFKSIINDRQYIFTN